ncbi:MAG: MFS transporter [Chloroflexota bacterium]|nr:MFS transporter [Chloroflexota bacterium]
MNIELLPNHNFDRATKLLLVVSGVFAISFYGIQILLKVLYVLRLGYGPQYVGLFNATGVFTYMGMSIPSGALGTRFGPKRVMFVGGVITVLGMTILPLAEFVPLWLQVAWPIASQAFLTMGWSMLNVNLVPALMAVTTPKTRNGAYALSNALRGLGTFLGTVVGGMLPGWFAKALGQTLDLPGPYRLSLWVGAVVGLAGLMPIFLMRDVDRSVSKKEKTEPQGTFPLLPVALMVLHVYFSNGGWATSQSFFNAYADTDLQLSPASIGLITGVGQFLCILAPFVVPRLADHRSNRWTLMTAAFGMGFSMLPLGLIPHWGGAALGRASVLALSAVWMPALQVFQMEMLEEQWRSLGYGAVSTAMGLAFAYVSLAGGLIIAARGYRTLFLLGGALSIVGGMLMAAIRRYRA